MPFSSPQIQSTRPTGRVSWASACSSDQISADVALVQRTTPLTPTGRGLWWPSPKLALDPGAKPAPVEVLTPGIDNQASNVFGTLCEFEPGMTNWTSGEALGIGGWTLLIPLTGFCGSICQRSSHHQRSTTAHASDYGFDLKNVTMGCEIKRFRGDSACQLARRGRE